MTAPRPVSPHHLCVPASTPKATLASTPPPLNIAALVLAAQGWVMKESAMIRSYRRRWLVLTPENLYSFKQERRYENPTEEVDLKLCGTVKSADDLTSA